MKIRLNSLKEGLQILSYTLKKSELNLTDKCFSRQTFVTLSVNRGYSEISINGKIQTIAELECDRCLSFYQQDLNSSFKIILSQVDLSIMNSNENIIPISSNTNEVDITSPIRDTLILSVPMKKLCRKDCKGLCPKCGVNLNIEKCKCVTTSIDSRWNPLKKILANVKEE